MLKSDEQISEEDVNEIIVGEQLLQLGRKPAPEPVVEKKETPPKKSFFRRVKEKVVIYIRKLTLADIRFIGEESEDNE